LSHKGNINIL